MQTFPKGFQPAVVGGQYVFLAKSQEAGNKDLGGEGGGGLGDVVAKPLEGK